MKTKKFFHHFICILIISLFHASAQSASSPAQNAKIPEFVNFAKPGFLAVNYIGENEKNGIWGIDIWGVMDYNGNLIYDGESQWISPIYDSAGNISFSNSDGFSIYGEKGKGYGVVNRDNMVVVKPGFTGMKIFEKYCIAEDSEGELSIIHLPSLSVVEKFKPDFNIYEVKGFSEGKILVLKDDIGYSFYDMKGGLAIPFELLSGYEEAGTFHEGRAVVMKESGDDILCGYIDETGKEIIPARYVYEESWGEECMGFSNGRVIVSDTDFKAGVIDRDGKVIVPFIYSYIRPYENGKAEATIEDDDNPSARIVKWFDLDGKETTPPAPNDDDDVLEITRDDESGLEGYADKNGKIVIRPSFDIAFPFNHGHALVQKDGKVSLIDKSGKVILRNIAKDVYIVG
ncbi:MAG: WG repeat-containing protein [Muribaculaceae bacterium]|nr:WG repeat-containing protein [Muribaculaceae bacterium]